MSIDSSTAYEYDFNVLPVSTMFFRVMTAASHPSTHGLALTPQEAMMVWIIEEQRKGGYEALVHNVHNVRFRDGERLSGKINSLIEVIRGSYFDGRYNVSKLTAVLSYAACFTKHRLDDHPQWRLQVASKLAEYFVCNWPCSMASLSKDLFDFDELAWSYFFIKQKLLVWKTKIQIRLPTRSSYNLLQNKEY
ncbi:hypothetical protein KM481_gp04 [Harp seal herpesvirus]|uniref:Uncharacterized protein n=1 Tax=phocid gammaherpesvirus 3 TaxID=2560643 RepID=A0A0R5Z675_9GAMA|nr:hypothetical protein KM481_gp04 [Harp seal herpesvirus]AJG42934.1 hypothetical protein [Harp seal herpesvirus]